MGFLLEDIIKIKLPGTRKRKPLREVFATVDKNIEAAQSSNRQVKATLNGEDRWFTCSEVDKHGNTVG
uniref:Uncharacterized protein n=1 Tax=viral metagenome TaxID=1070528 RepID=A0A6M3KI87_9ZZZZ